MVLSERVFVEEFGLWKFFLRVVIFRNLLCDNF